MKMRERKKRGRNKQKSSRVVTRPKRKRRGRTSRSIVDPKGKDEVACPVLSSTRKVKRSGQLSL